MGLGGTTKKLQRIVDMAEELYDRLNYLREQLTELRQRVDQTGSQVERLQHEQAVNRALLERLAEQQDIDVEEVLETVPNEKPTAQQGQQNQHPQQGQQNQHPQQGQQNQHPQQGQQNQQRQNRENSSRSSTDTTARRDDRPPEN